MTPPLTFSEWRPSEVDLSQEAASALASEPRMRLQVTPIGAGRYRILPKERVGTIVIGDLQVIVRPAKLSMQRVLWMLNYGVERATGLGDLLELGADGNPEEVVARSFAHLVDRALARGVLQGYRTIEESSASFRGRLRTDDQARKRFGRFPPAEVRYDEFTEDIEENRLLRAALESLLALPLRDPVLRGRLRRQRTALGAARSVRYRAGDLPATRSTRLNARYQPALALGRVILANTAFELREGHVASASFVLDMNEVFERFVHRALETELELGRGMTLRYHHSIDLAERTTFRDGSSRVGGLSRTLDSGVATPADALRTVVDAKYKVLGGTAERDDIHQLLAYCVATGMPGGVLVYVAGKGPEAVHAIRHTGIEIHVMTVNLARTPERSLEDIRRVARVVERLTASEHAAPALRQLALA